MTLRIVHAQCPQLLRNSLGLGAFGNGRNDHEVADLVAELTAREERYAMAFSDLKALRVAVDQELADFDAPLEGVREVAFFPPRTGG